MTVHYLGDPMFRAFDSNGDPLAGGLLDTWEEGSSTPKASFADATGLVANTNPVVLDSVGRAEVWLEGKYKLRLRNATGSIQWTMDNVAGIGFVAAAATVDEWNEFTDSTPAFIDDTNFSVAGDKRTTFQVNRRVRATVSAGTLYGTITDSEFTTVTTVTVVWDAGVLDSGLSAAAVGFISADNPSINWQAIDDIEHSTVVAGTRMLFQQETPPTGWTKEVSSTYTDAALKLVTAAAGVGGVDTFSTVFGTGKETLGHVLIVDELPIHGHALTAVRTDTDGDHGHPQDGATVVQDFGGVATGPSSSDNSSRGGTTGDAGDHDHGLVGDTDDAGLDEAHMHGLTANIKFAECTIGIKD